MMPKGVHMVGPVRSSQGKEHVLQHIRLRRMVLVTVREGGVVACQRGRTRGVGGERRFLYCAFETRVRALEMKVGISPASRTSMKRSAGMSVTACNLSDVNHSP